MLTMDIPMVKRILLLCLALTTAEARATPPDTAAGAPVIAAPSTLPPNLSPYPIVEASRQLGGATLLKELRAGGFVLYMRHADTGKVTRDCVESNLSTVGEEQAKTLGNALRSIAIRIGQFESSEVCRVRDTARLLDLGSFQTNEDLNNLPKRPGHDLHAARARRLATPPPRGQNALLVAHLHAGQSERERLTLEIGEVIVFRPDGAGGSEPVARIRLTDWAALLALR